MTHSRHMQALEFRLSIPKFLLTRGLSHLAAHRFFSGVSCLQLRDVAVPELPGPDWVRVKVALCGICGTDQNTVRGHESFSMEPYASFPAVMGHETIGVIESLGAQVENLSVGSRVVVEPVLPCVTRGIEPPCRFCTSGAYGLCENFANGALPAGLILGFTRGLGGGFGEYVVAHRSQIFTIPDALSNEEAVLVDALASSFQPVAAHLPANDQTVLVVGAGIIGLNAIQSLRACGFTGRILVIARHDFQAAWCRTLGADEVIRGNIFHTIAKLMGAKVHKTSLGPPVLDGGVDCVFDCVGSSQTVDTSLRLTRKRGKVVVIGTTNALSGIDASPFWFKEITLMGSSMYDHSTVAGKRARTYQHVIDLLTEGKLRADGLLTHTFPIQDYRQAFATALDKQQHQSIKVAFQS